MNQRWLLIIVSCLTIFSLAASGWLFYQNLQLKRQLAQLQTQPSPSPAATPMPSADPTAGWKTYTNTEYGYSIKYPNDYISGYENVLYGEFIESSGNEDQLDVLPFTEDILQQYYSSNGFDNFLRILVFNTKTFNEFNKPLAELAGNIYQQQKSHFKTTYISNLTNSEFDGYDDYEYLFSGPSLFMLSGATSVKDGKYKTVIFQKGGDIYSFYLKNIDIFNQILSTFKFLDNDNNSGMASPKATGKTECPTKRPQVCTMECIQPPPYLCGSDGKSYCTICQACSNKDVAWYEMKTFPCGEGQFCGGFAGAVCPEGYSCKYDGNYPDAGGKCLKN